MTTVRRDDVDAGMKALALFAPMLCVVAVVVAIHGRRASTSPPAAEPAAPVTIDVRSVGPGPSSSTEPDPAAISASIATVCGADPSTADRYEARNDALRSISRDRNLPADDVGALVSWLASTNDVLHTERLAALKNDARFCFYASALASWNACLTKVMTKSNHSFTRRINEHSNN